MTKFRVNLRRVKTTKRQEWENRLNTRLAQGGFRFTSQRQQVYSILMENLDHPTAEQVFMRAKQSMPEISMATVYNCLDALVKCDLVNEVVLDRAATRYCPNMQKHYHFHCEECGRVYDVSFTGDSPNGIVQLPNGFQVRHMALSIHGLCAGCGQDKAGSRLSQG